MIKIGIVGYGYWGKNLVRNFYYLNGCHIKHVCEINLKKAKKCSSTYPNINVVNDFNIILNDKDIDGIVIATPVDSHYDLAKKALERNKNVLVEKPLTSSFEEAKELIDLANVKGKLLMVDHTYLYTGAVIKLKELD